MRILRGLMAAALTLLCAPLVLCQTQAAMQASLPQGHEVVLDKVIAIINGSVLLQSDVDEEMRLGRLEPFRVLPGQDTEQRAAQRLINRTLVLQQMGEQQQQTTVSAAQVEKSLDEVREQLPACAAYDCKTDKGWDAFLTAQGLTLPEVQKAWSQRLAILKFIDLRFRAGIRISKPEIEEYYRQTLVPGLEKAHQRAPALDSVSERIEEILLQQRVNSLLEDWLESLRQEGSVQVIDPAYGASPHSDSVADGDNE